MDKQYWRKTKIIATVGPSSASKSKITELIKEGVNIFRLNMSHGEHESHYRIAKNIKSAANDLNINIAILVDLSGPKIRIGKFESGSAVLIKGQDVVITCKKIIGDSKVFTSQYNKLYKDVKKGDRIFIDDGKIELLVKKIHDKDIKCKVENGGELKDNKGINLPDSDLSITSFTRKDRRDTDFAIKINADFIALSFVNDKRDINKLEKYLIKHGAYIPVIAKIERKNAIDNIEEIIDCSYGVMIARGDLGIECPAWKIPVLQRTIVDLSQKAAKPVVVATQMLESMIYNPRPTRAEVGDVANAAMIGVDAVMLSAETASGEYPVEAVRIMNEILVENELFQLGKDSLNFENKDNYLVASREAISHAVTALAKNMKLAAIIIPTRSGTTAVVMAARRPLSQLVAVCADKKVCRRLLLHWGIISFNVNKELTRNWHDLCQKIADKCIIKTKSSVFLLVSGFNDDITLNEPVIKLINL